jgi:hypothetical protein
VRGCGALRPVCSPPPPPPQGLVASHELERDKVAYAVLLLYMLALHLPEHYRRVSPVTASWGWALLTALGAVSWWLEPVRLLYDHAWCRRAAVTLIVAHTSANQICALL